jgi:hypothetical protein
LEAVALEGLAGPLEVFESVVEAVEAASAEVPGAAADVGNSRILAVAEGVATESCHVPAADPETPVVLAVTAAAAGILAVDPELAQPLLAAMEAVA